MAYDSRIVIDSTINNEGIQKGIKAAKDEINKMSSALNSVNSQMVKQQAIVDDLSKKYEEAAANAEKIGKDFGLDSAEFENAAKSVDNISQSLTAAESKLSSFKSQSDALKTSLSNISTSGADGIKDVGQYAQQTADKADRLKSAIGGIVAAAKGIAGFTVSAFKKVGSAIGAIASVAVKAGKGIINLGKNLLTANRHANTASKGFLGLGNRIWSMIKTVAVFNVIRSALNALKKDLGAVLMANHQFANSWNAIKVNMLTAFAPIWEVIQPAIITFMDLLAKFTSMLAQFMATLFGKTFQQAKQSAKGIYDQSKAIDKLGKSAKNALAPIDELTVLTSDLGGADTGGLDFEAVEVPDYSWIDEFASKLKELEPDLDYFYNLGFELGNKIADALEKIDWDYIQKFVEGKVKALAAFLNGLVDNDRFWEALGNTIKEGIRTALIAANTFLEEFHWYDFGVRIAEIFNKLIDLMPELGRLLGNAIDAALKTANGFIDTFHWYDFGVGLADIFNNLITRLPKIGTTLGNLINGLLTSAQGFIENFHWEDLGVYLAQGLENLIKAVDLELLGLVIGELINGIFDTLAGFIETFPWEEIGQLFADGFTSLTDAIKWEEIGTTIKNGIQGVLTLLYTAITGYNWGKLGKQFASLLNNALTDKEMWVQLGGTFASGINAAIDFLLDFVRTFDWIGFGQSVAAGLNKAINDIKWAEAGQALSDGIKGILTSVGEFIRGTDWYEIGKSIKTFIEKIDWNGIVSEIGWLLGNAFGGLALLLKGALEDVVNGIIEHFTYWIEQAKEEFGDNGVAIVLGILAGIGKAIANIGKWLWDNLLVPFINGVKEVFGIHSPSTVMAEIGVFIIQGLLDGIKSLVDSVIEFFEGLLKSIQDVFKNIGQWFADRWSDISNSFSAVGTFFQTTFDTAWTNIKNVFSDAGKWFTDTVWGGIKNAFSNVTTWLKDKFSEAWQAVKNVFSTGGQIFLGIKDGILEGLKAVINGLIDGINRVIRIPFDGINSALQAIKGVNILGVTPFSWLPTISVPQIPRLKSGMDYVPTDYFGPVYLDKGEAVLTASENEGYQSLMATLNSFSTGSDIVSSLAEKGKRTTSSYDNGEWKKELISELSAQINNNSNDVLSSKLDILIELMRAGQTIEVDGETFGRTAKNAINSYGRRTGTAMYML